MSFASRPGKPLGRGPVAYLIVSASAVLLGVVTGPLGIGPAHAAVGALFFWVLMAAAAEIVVGAPRRLGVLPWAIGATVAAAFCGPGAIMAVLGAAAAGYGLRTIAMVMPVRRFSLVLPGVETAAPSGARRFGIATDLNGRPASNPATTGAILALTLS
ncbi:hypothetical protein [Actinoplanes sp. L3-i22]|uniref:hypothetical protein n=1 Tax=Actinoplanes sp. L3-i22 TaxID=2836373 RepID=UPI001C76FDF3|nr:hypothetical protein [Actinoplanes sp. L3-i22]BCY09033.1 hypothetical protein L3i22_041210 [Actinoplanes sp. L3-i22]